MKWLRRKDKAFIKEAGRIIAEQESSIQESSILEDECNTDKTESQPYFLKRLENTKRKYNRKRMGAAILSAAVILLFCGFAAHQIIYYLIRTDYKDNSRFTLSAENTNGLNESYELTYIPEGFSLEGEKSSNSARELRYTNEIGELLVFLASGAETEFNIDNKVEQKEVELTNGNTAILFLKNGSLNTIFWQEGDKIMSISGPFDDTTMVNIANGVTEK